MQNVEVFRLACYNQLILILIYKDYFIILEKNFLTPFSGMLR